MRRNWYKIAVVKTGQKALGGTHHEQMDEINWIFTEREFEGLSWFG
jgi:hypothetical protein